MGFQIQVDCFFGTIHRQGMRGADGSTLKRKLSRESALIRGGWSWLCPTRLDTMLVQCQRKDVKHPDFPRQGLLPDTWRLELLIEVSWQFRGWYTKYIDVLHVCWYRSKTNIQIIWCFTWLCNICVYKFYVLTCIFYIDMLSCAVHSCFLSRGIEA